MWKSSRHKRMRSRREICSTLISLDGLSLMEAMIGSSIFHNECAHMNLVILATTVEYSWFSLQDKSHFHITLDLLSISN